MAAELPSILYIFVNQLRPTTQNNAKLGTFTSGAYTTCSFDSDFAKRYLEGNVDYLPFTPNPAWDVQALSPFLVSSMSDYTCEYHAELTRRAEFPLLPSRLSATYAFSDYATRQAVAAKYPSWDLSSVIEFELGSAGDPFTRVARVNMEVVSLMRYAFVVSSLDEETTKYVWRHYWSGAGSLPMELPGADFKREMYHSGEIWEYLIEGRLDIVK